MRSFMPFIIIGLIKELFILTFYEGGILCNCIMNIVCYCSLTQKVITPFILRRIILDSAAGNICMLIYVYF